MTELLPPIERYFTERNARRFDEALSLFAPSAVVQDEGEVYRGRDEILAWMKKTAATYDDRASVLAAEEDGACITVRASVSGTFPGSPAEIRFAFTLADDGFAGLEIGV